MNGKGGEVQRPKQERNPTIDCAKGIILIAVLLSHTCGFLIGGTKVASALVICMAVTFIVKQVQKSYKSYVRRAA